MMKKYVLIFIHVAFALILLTVACSSPVQKKLKGNWHSKDGITKLKITDKTFITNDDEAIPENYFLKGDTIYTSFEGNEPLTQFVVQRLDDHNLQLMGTDSVSVDYSR
jgi:hypothetical protein